MRRGWGSMGNERADSRQGRLLSGTPRGGIAIAAAMGALPAVLVGCPHGPVLTSTVDMPTRARIPVDAAAWLRRGLAAAGYEVVASSTPSPTPALTPDGASPSVLQLRRAGDAGAEEVGIQVLATCRTVDA